MRACFKIIFFANLMLPTVVFSATQGALGSTSTSTVNVSIIIPPMVQTTGLGDITLGSTSTFPATGNTSICVYSNVTSPSGSYYVTATSLNSTGTNFRVKDTGTDYIAYSAFWNNTSTATQTTALTSGTKTAQQTGGNAVSLTCGGTPNANFNISFSASQVQGAPAATYSDVVTLVISPS